MDKERLIKIIISLSVISLLYFRISIQRPPEDDDYYGVCGEWKYQGNLEDYDQELYLDICESGVGEKYDIKIFEDISDEPIFSGYMVIYSFDKLTIYYDADGKFELPEPWQGMETVQRFSYKLKNKLFSNDEFHITYEDGEESSTLVFERQD